MRRQRKRGETSFEDEKSLVGTRVQTLLLETLEAAWRISVIFHLNCGVKNPVTTKCSSHIVSVVASVAWKNIVKVKDRIFKSFVLMNSVSLQSVFLSSSV